MDQDEVIKQLLSKTGWTCDDLIQRLNTFKNATVISENQVLSPQSCNATEIASTFSTMLKHDKDHIGTEDVSELHSFTKEIQSLNPGDNIEFLNNKDAGDEEAQVADSPKLTIATIEVNKGCQVVAKNRETNSIKRHEDNKTIKNLGTLYLPNTSSLETNYISKRNDYTADFKSSVNPRSTITYTKKILDKNKKIVIKSTKTGTNSNNADVKYAHGASNNSSNLFSVATKANMHNISSSMSTTDNNFLYDDVSTKNDKRQFKKADSAVLKYHPKKKSFCKITEASYVNNNSPTLKCYKNNKSPLNGSVPLKYKDLVSSEMTKNVRKNIDLPEKERKQELPTVKLTNLGSNDNSKSMVDGNNYTTKLETASEPLKVKSKTDKASNIDMKVNEMKNSKTLKRDISNVTERLLTNYQCENIKKDVMLEDANKLYIQTNEVDFIISGVQGGVELEATKIASYSNEFVSNCDKKMSVNICDESKGNDNTIQEDKKKSVCDQIMEMVKKQKNTINYNTLNVIKNEPDTNTCLNLKENSRLSMEISQSSFSIENYNIAENSGFGCIKLNNHLAANSKFNTNHEVPKLIAQEKNAKKIVEKTYFAKKKPELHKYIDTPSIKFTTMVKPKTVAEKRRLLELAKRNELQITEKTKPKWKQPTSFKYVNVKKELLDPPKNSQLKITETPKAKRKQFHNKKDGTDKKELKHVSLKTYARRASYVLYTNRKIWVNTVTPNKCVANINCIKRDAKSPTHRKKLSLLNQRYKRSKRLLYRPGPLCKKELLQITGSNLWNTQLLKLPKISLEVFPQQGKRFCDTVLHRLNTIVGGEMDSTKIEFALSALKSKADNESNNLQSIKFSLTYQNNVENILVRKKKFISQIEPINKRNSSSLSVDHESVASVIEDLIKYVEIKEIASSLIKEDEIKVKDEIATEAQLELPIENNLCNKRRKRTKVERELLRLNHKVVNVELTNDKEDVYIVCNKPYCKLGCICNSLKYDFLSDHCQKLACMFNCTCSKHKSFRYDELNLHSGTNLLSKDAVTRIEDEAKKHLAKVEREFTQTVIHTNDKTILIGVGDRAKSRRAAKVPAKFLDFVASEEKPENVSQTCYVSLEKLDLSEVIQLCLTHYMYSCQCEGLVIPELKKESKLITSINTQLLSENDKKEKKYKRHEDEIDHRHRIDFDLNENGSLNGTEEDDNWIPDKNLHFKSEIKEPSRILQRGSARCRPIEAKYKRLEKYNKTIHKNDFKFKVTKLEEDKLQAFIDKNLPLSDSQLLKHSIITDKYMSFNLAFKQKPTHEFHEDSSNSVKTLDEGECFQKPNERTMQGQENINITPVFDGEIIIDNSNIELLKKMGSKDYARLIPWKSLIEGFRNSSINIWCTMNQPIKLLINKSGKTCPKNFVNILSVSENSPIITWIKRNKLPRHYQEDSLLFLLNETKGNYEICGICTKNITSSSNEISSDQNDVGEEYQKPETLYHKDIQGTIKSFLLSKRQYNIQHLLPSESTDSIQPMKVALPEIFTFCKWQTIFLNSDFTFLFFNKIPYSIRYTDLILIADYAKDNKCTVYVRNDELRKEYNHKQFGIYFVETFCDRIFIGPYFNYDVDNDVETLRYVNKSLISSESFNLMSGKENSKSCYWLKEAPKNKMLELNQSSEMRYQEVEPVISKKTNKSSTDAENTIDLTSDDDESKTKSDISQNSSKVFNDYSLVKIIEASPKNPEDYNRYIVTNIPHFGYLGAFKNVNGEIDVSWPFENKLLRFGNENSATSFLQKRFTSLLIGVPESFKISIIVTCKIDLEKYKPVDPIVLSGQFICGDFGYLHVSKVDKDPRFIQTGICKEEVVRLMLKRNQQLIIQKFKTLASLLQIEGEKNIFNQCSILYKAIEEIRLLEKKEREYLELKNILFLRKRKNFLQMYTILSKLPPEQRNIENLKFRAILDANESSTIEIKDSDDELQIVNREKVPTAKSAVNVNLKSILKPLVPLPINRESSHSSNEDQKSSTDKSIPDIIKKHQYVKASEIIENKFRMVKIPQTGTIAERSRFAIADTKDTIIRNGNTFQTAVEYKNKSVNGKLQTSIENMVDADNPVSSVIIDLDDIPSDNDL
ncbi:uncharacterized protein ocm isoform X2 [Diabrotica undecimpunctata]|uniref:uncharacterized protein ocm isoform X2 n=1 Tax=Diabrotica undecimpunctata TaxID=50387 RepID=UPI003B639E43